MTENAIEEWIHNAIPPGSGRYYAILHAHPAAQPHLRVVITLISIWSKLCFSNREIEVAQKKMDWWREELNRPEHLHPVTRELQQLTGGTSISPELRSQLSQIHQGYSSLLTSGSPATEKANQQFHRLTGASAGIAFCHTDSKPTQTEHIQQAGILLSRLRCLRYLNKHVTNGLMCLPMVELEARDIKPNQFTAGAMSPNTIACLEEMLNDLHQEIEQCLQQMLNPDTAATDSNGNKSFYIYLQLQLHILKVMQKNVGQLFLPDARLSPLRNYWIALRAATRFDKAARRQARQLSA